MLAAAWLLATGAAVAAEQQPLPEPLSLDDALAFSRTDTPVLEMALARRDERAAALLEAEAVSGIRLDAVGRLRAVRPAYVSPDRDSNDSSASLALRKRLYDFGYSASREKAARLAGDGGEWRLLQARQQARLEVMRSFFDVILADLQFARDNEAMAGAFITADRAADRHELKRLSDVELLRVQALYEEALQARSESESLQRAARSQLAIAMGRPEDLVSNLVRPAAPDVTVERAEYDQLWADVLENNPELKALRAEIDAAQARVEAARRGNGPVLSGELDASVYNRTTSSTHPLGAALVLEVPLLTGGAKDAAVAASRAELRASRARLESRKLELRQQLLLLWQRQGNLKRRLNGLKVRGDYRELYLDRSRALYELEVKTDLGDAMTEISAVRLAEAEAEFDWILTSAELEALAGRLLPQENTL